MFQQSVDCVARVGARRRTSTGGTFAWDFEIPSFATSPGTLVNRAHARHHTAPRAHTRDASGATQGSRSQADPELSAVLDAGFGRAPEPVADALRVRTGVWP